MTKLFQAEEQSYYDVLDIKPDASPNDIRQAYFRAKAAYSKDSAALYSLFDEHETKHLLEMIEQAYIVLSNLEKRKEYDKLHGFFSNETFLPVAKKSTTQGGVFSFDKMETEAAEPNPAEQAAKVVLGDSAPIPPMSTSAATTQHEDYSTPRTLDSANFNQMASTAAPTTPTPTSTSSQVDLTLKNTKLGYVRRVDLLKNYPVNAALEDEIAKEAAFHGPFLKKVREYKNITVDEMADFTKISKTYINCIESEDFENLPAPAYLRGFVIQIAKALKLPHDKVATGYMDNYKNSVNK